METRVDEHWTTPVKGAPQLTWDVSVSPALQGVEAIDDKCKCQNLWRPTTNK